MEDVNQKEETLEPLPGHQTWSGSVSMGLVNIPVRAIPITLGRKISFRMLHQKCSTPISYKLFCEDGDEVPKSEIAFGYKLKGHDYWSSIKRDNFCKTRVQQVDRLDKFIEFFQVDPH